MNETKGSQPRGPRAHRQDRKTCEAHGCTGSHDMQRSGASSGHEGIETGQSGFLEWVMQGGSSDDG